MKKRRFLSLALALILALAAALPAAAETADPIKLSMWIGLGDKHSSHMTNLDEMTVFQELQKRMNVDIEFIHPAQGQSAEAYQLMLASGNFPDVVSYDWATQDVYELIDDGFLLDMSEEMVKTYAPNFYSIVTGNETLYKQATLNGKFYYFPMLTIDSGLRAGGHIIRADWLEKLTLETPVTLDDWYSMLVAFRDQDPNGNGLKDEIPLIARSDNGHDLETLHSFTCAFGVISGFCMKGDEITYGPIEEGYRQYLTTMAKWYAEGLIDPDFASTQQNNFNAKACDVGGAWTGRISGSFGNFLAAMGDSDYSLTGAAWCQTADGHSYNLRSNMLNLCATSGLAITTACQNVEEAMRVIDYAFSPEGHLLFNFGLEGETYSMVDGVPVYSDALTNSPDGQSLSNVLSKHSIVTTGGYAMSQDLNYFLQTLQYPQQKQAIAEWGKSEVSLLVPPLAFTSDESARLSEIMADINTMADEWMVKTIMGQIAVEEFDTYVNRFKSMGIEEAIEIYNTAYARYLGK